MISTAPHFNLFTIGRQRVISDAINEWCKRLQACICAKGRYFKHLMQMFTFCDQKKNQVISSKTLEISSKGLYFYIIQLPIRPKCSDYVRSFYGFRPNSGLILKIIPNACRHLKNLCKLGLRPKFGLRTTKSDLFYQVTQCIAKEK